MVAASALLVGLQVADKEVKLLSSKAPTLKGQKATLTRLSELKTELGHQNLSISFDYSEEAVDKVSYHIGEETNKFYLTVKPKKGYEPLDTNSVEFSYTGAEVDLIILIGVGNLEELEQLYFGYEKLYQDTATISIYDYPTNHGTVKYDVTQTTGYAELIAQMLNQLGLHIDAEHATNLLSALEQTSRGFSSPNTSAESFELVAQLLRLGAVRQVFEQPSDNKANNKQASESSSHREITPKAQEISISRSASSNSRNNSDVDRQKKKNHQYKNQAKPGNY
jgi:hypothetical protein